MSVTEAAIDSLAADASFSGVVSIDTAGDVEFVKAYGFSHRAHGVAMTPDTRIAIASGSKAFTALAVLSLVEEGALALDVPVRSITGQ